MSIFRNCDAPDPAGLSLRLDLDRAYHLAPFVDVTRNQLLKRFGRAADRNESHLEQGTARFGILENGINISVQPRYDRARRACRRDHTLPGAEIEFLHAKL